MVQKMSRIDVDYALVRIGELQTRLDRIASVSDADVVEHLRAAHQSLLKAAAILEQRSTMAQMGNCQKSENGV